MSLVCVLNDVMSSGRYKKDAGFVNFTLLLEVLKEEFLLFVTFIILLKGEVILYNFKAFTLELVASLRLSQAYAFLV